MSDTNSIVQVVKTFDAKTIHVDQINTEGIFVKLEGGVPYVLQANEHEWMWINLTGLYGRQLRGGYLKFVLVAALDKGAKVWQLRYLGDLADWLKLVHEGKI
jgi:hypothetical protein